MTVRVSDDCGVTGADAGSAWSRARGGVGSPRLRQRCRTPAPQRCQQRGGKTQVRAIRHSTRPLRARRCRHNRRDERHDDAVVDGSTICTALPRAARLRARGFRPARSSMVAMMKRLRERFGELRGVRLRRPGTHLSRRLVRPVQGPPYPMPEPLVQQIEPIHEVVRLLGWPTLVVPASRTTTRRTLALRRRGGRTRVASPPATRT